jgi:hypothetical protein
MACTSQAVGYDGYNITKDRKIHLTTDSSRFPVAGCVGLASQHDKPDSKCLQEQVEGLAGICSKRLLPMEPMKECPALMCKAELNGKW